MTPSRRPARPAAEKSSAVSSASNQRGGIAYINLRVALRVPSGVAANAVTKITDFLAQLDTIHRNRGGSGVLVFQNPGEGTGGVEIRAITPDDAT